MINCKMIKLFNFLENIGIDNNIKILDESDNVLFDGKVGDVPLRVTHSRCVIKETVINHGEYLTVKVEEY